MSRSTLVLAFAPIVVLLGACASSPMPGGMGSTASTSTQTNATVLASAASGTEQGRDWSLVDSNRDNLVSAAEMEAWLAANPGPLKPR